MSRVFLHGWGAVSPAGWGAETLHQALLQGAPLPTHPLVRPGHAHPLSVRRVPAVMPRPAFLAHPRLRRTSPITHFAVAAAIEALGGDAARVATGEVRLGIIFCAFAGCVSYSRRFYDETLRDPATASPLVFPETVFNAPASHLAAYFGTTAINYTLVGDQGEFVKALALAADWLLTGRVEGCLVVGSEESDWLSADALRLVAPAVIAAEGAGAVYLRSEPGPVELVAVTEPQLFTQNRGRPEALRQTRAQLDGILGPDFLLVTSEHDSQPVPNPVATSDWTHRAKHRITPAPVLGEGLGAGSAWQAVAASVALRDGEAAEAVIEVLGSNEQAVAAVLRRA
jgi:3-oxoacyl-(acyl-carrier-protein) synthase